MKQRILSLVAVLLLVSFSGFSQGNLEITWKEGKDNLHKQPAVFRVTDSSGNPVEGATVILEEANLGKTNKKGELISAEANNSLAKYNLSAKSGADKSKVYPYHVQNSTNPALVFVTFGSDPASSMSFAWQTDIKTKGTVVEYVKYDDAKAFSSKNLAKAEGTSYNHDFIDVLGENSITRPAAVHKVTASGLSPDTKYRYRVGDGKTWEEGSFVTGTQKIEPFSFIFVPDTQESTKKNYDVNFKGLIDYAFTDSPDSKFVIHVGDAVQAGANAQEYEWFYDAGEQFFKNVPLVPVLGNHEAKGVHSNEHFNNYFNNIPNDTKSFGKGSSYAFDYSNVHFIVLDMTSFSKLQKNKEELKEAMVWIENELKKTSPDQWNIVAMHQSIYSTARDYKKERSLLAPLFEKYKVSLVLTGHDHVYMRTHPIKYNPDTNEGITAKENEFGTVYVIGGSGCKKIYEQKNAHPYQALIMAKADYENRDPGTIYKPATTQNFLVVNVDSEGLRVKSIAKDGEVWDEFLVKRPQAN